MLKKYKGRESIPVADAACVVQSVHTTEQQTECDAMVDIFLLLHMYFRCLKSFREEAVPPILSREGEDGQKFTYSRCTR